MGLVDYSDSESEDDKPAAVRDISQGAPDKRKRKSDDTPDCAGVRTRPPPLPALFRSLYATSVRTSTNDDPALHGGRRRQIPHIEGNWPSHVFLEWLPDTTELQRLDEIIDAILPRSMPNYQNSTARPVVYPFLRSDLGAQLPLHISLSAPLALNTQVKDDFLLSLSTALKRARITAFHVHVVGLDWVANFDRSRYFLVLRLADQVENQLYRLLNTCNQTYRAYGLPQLYHGSDMVGINQTASATEKTAHSPISNPGASPFHISVAWMLEEPSSAMQEALAGVTSERFSSLSIRIEEVKIKIGNIVSSVALKDAE